MNKRLLATSFKILSSLLVVFTSFNSFFQEQTPLNNPLLFRTQNSNNTLTVSNLNHLNLKVWNTILSILSLVLNLLSIGVVGWFGYKAYQDIQQKISSFTECKSKKK